MLVLIVLIGVTAWFGLNEIDEGFNCDTPGIREFGLSGLRRAELADFPEIAALEECRFGDCSHTQEPGCAVKAAVRQGRVSKTRYHSYTGIRRSLLA